MKQDLLKQDLLKIRTLGELRAAGVEVLPVRLEMRRNLLNRLRARERILPGIIGYDQTGAARNRKRRARRPSHGLSRRTRAGQVASSSGCSPTCSTSAWRRSRAARSMTIPFAPICGACRRRAGRIRRRAGNRMDRTRAALRRKAGDARRLGGRSDRRDRSDQGRRGALPGRRGDHPLRPHPAHQPRHLRDQRTARPDREGPGRTVQPDGREGRPDQRATRSACRSTWSSSPAPIPRTTPRAAASSRR